MWMLYENEIWIEQTNCLGDSKMATCLNLSALEHCSLVEMQSAE